MSMRAWISRMTLRSSLTVRCFSATEPSLSPGGTRARGAAKAATMAMKTDFRPSPPFHRALAGRSATCSICPRCSGCGACASSVSPTWHFPRPNIRASRTRWARSRWARARSTSWPAMAPEFFADERDVAYQRRSGARRAAAARRRPRPVQPCVRGGARRAPRSANAGSARLAEDRRRGLDALGVDRRDVLGLIVGESRERVSGAAGTGQRAEPRRRPHGLSAARCVLYRRRRAADTTPNNWSRRCASSSATGGPSPASTRAAWSRSSRSSSRAT